MKKAPLFFCAVLLMSCCKRERRVSVCFASPVFVADTIYEDIRPTTLNEYYTLSVENELYDTLSFIVTNLNNSKNKAVLVSEILYYAGEKISGGSLINNGLMPDNYKISILMHQNRNIVFLMPEFSDTTTKKSYFFLAEFDSLNKKNYRYIEISSKNGVFTTCQKVNIKE